ncbi:unnamed protein product [Auanema sp. JU1783]|nr:unnamed protein product [Auanema sp. JU1783]
MKAAVIFLLTLLTVCECIRIPLLLGDLKIGKREDGKVDINFSNNLDVGGFGAGKNTTLTVSNDTFVVNDNSHITSNGTRHEVSSQTGFIDDEVKVEGNANINNQNIRMGLGENGSHFIGDVSRAIQNSTKKP